jgi:hypothetical protein
MFFPSLTRLGFSLLGDSRRPRGEFQDPGQLATGLVGWTSINDLCIVQSDVSHPYDGPLLRLSPVSKNKLEFRYEDTGIKAKQWHRTVDADEALSRLLTFLGQLRWFPAVVLESLGDKTAG